MSPGEAAILFAAATAGGGMNALAGGGTILTFPVLLLLGESAITANATSTVALLPGAAASLFGYRREVGDAPAVALDPLRSEPSRRGCRLHAPAARLPRRSSPAWLPA